LKGECETAAKAWEERQKGAAEEMAAIQKAKDILTSGVRVFMQVTSSNSKGSNTKGFIDEHSVTDDDDDDKVEKTRAAVVQKLKDLAHTSHSFAMLEMASAAGGATEGIPSVHPSRAVVTPRRTKITTLAAPRQLRLLVLVPSAVYSR
jgi:hypothetical protein